MACYCHKECLAKDFRGFCKLWWMTDIAIGVNTLHWWKDLMPFLPFVMKNDWNLMGCTFSIELRYGAFGDKVR